MGFDIYVSFIISHDENLHIYHEGHVFIYGQKSAFPQKKEDTKNDGRHKKKYG